MSQQPVQEVNYKQTLNLPVTDFQMKAGAAKREPEIETFWDEQQVYQKAQASRDKAHAFVLHDGPPYLSSDKIHIGTALNKILKDIVTRYKTQRGFYSPYVPGYDGHGLPIENAVVKSLKGGRQSVSPAKLRELCREFALANLKGQEVNFKRLGVWGHWDAPYITIDGPFEATQVKIFGELYQKGYVYKGLKPVYWCPTCETALADAEVEYGDHVSHSIYVGFPVEDSPNLEALKGARLVIWTTTPWTLPANLALSVHPDFEYVLIDSNHGKLVVAKELLAAFSEAVQLENVSTLATIKGAELEGLQTRHPFINRPSIVLTGTHVTLDAGTGIVHTAPGHGMEDYVVVQQYNMTEAGKKAPLPILSPLDNRGVFTAEAQVESLQGLHYEKGNEAVLEILRNQQALLQASKFSHSYPHCWRCHKPVIYRATEQWFISVEKFRTEALEAIRTVDWVPARGEARITSMVEGRGDWCISRQRVWGVPIPVFYCANGDCQKEWLTPEGIEHLYQLFSQHTSDIWWDWSNEQLLPPGTTCSACGSTQFNREMDIMDVWFDSGVTHTAVVEARAEELGHLPVALYLEGSDQHRGWFQSSLLTSVMLYGKAPYKSVLTHGFVLDEHGRKMSKSLGNVIEPQTVIQQFGADVLRLWVASVDYSNDVRIGNEIINQLAEVYKKVRNTVRYMMGNLFDFNPAEDLVPYDQLSLLDRFTLHRLAVIHQEITEAFDRYEFHRYYQVLQNFCVVDLSANYFDPVKDILYTYPAKGTVRRGVQTVLYHLLSAMVQMLVPVMPHLADDIWLNLPDHQRPKAANGQALPSVTMMPWPELPDGFLNEAVAEAMAPLLAVKELVNKSLEAPRSEGKLKNALETQVILSAKPDAPRDAVAQHLDVLPVLLIVSQVRLADAPAPSDTLNQLDSPEWTVSILPADGAKCQRCLKFSPQVGQFPMHPTLCGDCTQTVDALRA
jgi:isoleucyl-tRNA synthetase